MGVAATTNPILKVLALTAAATGAVLAMRACTRAPSTPSPLEGPPFGDAVTLGELGAEGDTEQETLRTLIAEVRRLHDEYAALESANEALRERNSRLERMEDRLATRLQQELQSAEGELRQDRERIERQVEATEGLLAALERRLAELTTRGDARPSTIAGSDLPVGLGLEPYIAAGEWTWIDPLDVPPEGQGGERSFPSRLDRLFNGVRSEPQGNEPRKPEAVYTVPRNATLVGARGFTALVGRIPVNGQVVDPFPFKLLVGADNLAANGIVMPELFGMVFSGRAVGDWTLQCVRGELFSVTYVFQDGSIQSYPEGNVETADTDPIGWISDPFGIPCVNGERKTNAQSFLSQRIGLSAASAAARAAAAAETATTVSGLSGAATTAVTGDIEAFIRNRTVSEGIDEISRWLAERQAQSFDAIYVPPDQPLVVHVTRELALDRDPNGRKVNHEVLQTPRARALD
jgi:integrating conjugative element protein (TIGR03752 family)